MIKSVFIVYYIIILIIFFFVIIPLFNKEESFISFYNNNLNSLKIMSKIFSVCNKNDKIFDCMISNNEKYPTKHDKEYFKTHFFNKSVYDNFNTNYNVLLYPKIKTDIHIVVGIPIAPSELISRIAIRETWGKIKHTKK